MLEIFLLTQSSTWNALSGSKVYFHCLQIDNSLLQSSNFFWFDQNLIIKLEHDQIL